ncbi:hypothetical protein E2C01_046565 [Portunus trituberculatus]|uniref:Uncharacterized protein n=1 Tax=Portunus trituberculatus TaxID=210409 RepID=A0A5B7FY87_PORTR|nr:hypothetical protein [Portunus trituberculatus]
MTWIDEPAGYSGSPRLHITRRQQTPHLLPESLVVELQSFRSIKGAFVGVCILHMPGLVGEEEEEERDRRTATRRERMVMGGRKRGENE